MSKCVRVLALAAAWILIGSSSGAAQEEERPRLVVALVIDQLRGDLLDHFAPALTQGFRRLVDEGFLFTQASHAHARTSTAPGHATLTTGVLPSRHAVVANAWAQRVGDEWRQTYAVEDPDSPILGFEEVEVLGGRSPRTMIREGLPDWLHAQDDDARIVSISKKDRAAIPMGGKTAEHVYWMLPELGRFITSRHYMDGYPGWLRRFNDEVMPGITSSRCRLASSISRRSSCFDNASGAEASEVPSN